MARPQTGLPKLAAPTPLRRSARITSTAGSESQLQSVATNTATPSRAGNRRKGALPKVKARESHAYGSTGRLGVAQELAVPVTGFAQAFEAQRDQAVARDEASLSDGSEHESVDDFRGVGRSHSVMSSHVSQSPGDHDHQSASSSRRASPQVQSDDSATSSYLDTSKSFGMQRESGMAWARRTLYEETPQGARISARASQVVRPSSRFEPLPANIPRPNIVVNAPNLSSTAGINGASRIPGSQAPNGRLKGLAPMREDEDDDVPKTHASSLLSYLMYIVAGVALALLIQSSLSGGMFGAIASRTAYTWNGIKEWIQPPPTSPLDLPDFRIPSADPPIRDGQGRTMDEPGYDFIFHRVKALEGVTKEFESCLQNLTQYLPPAVLVTRNKDDSLDIPDEFWRAIAKKMQDENLGGQSTSGGQDWNAFLERNHQNIIRALSDDLKNSDLRKTFKVVFQEEFVNLMRKEYAEISSIVDKKVEEAVKAMSKTVANDLVTKALLDQVRIESLAVSRLVANAEINLRKVNYFSPGLGAHIVPHESSSTFLSKSPSWTSSVYQSLFSIQNRRPPMAALEKWDDPGDCWCAAPDDKGKGLAQLSIALGHRMIPRQVTVEHLPKLASLDFTTAPKDFELWAETDETLGIHYDCSPAGRGMEKYKCLGKFSYNVHADNHIQTFDLDLGFTKPIHKTIVRVTENWGSDHTCLYRLRLHGVSTETDSE